MTENWLALYSGIKLGGESPIECNGEFKLSTSVYRFIIPYK